jgi:hypothetical protein
MATLVLHEKAEAQKNNQRQDEICISGVPQRST